MTCDLIHQSQGYKEGNIKYTNGVLYFVRIN